MADEGIDDSREQGIEVGDLADEVAAMGYAVSRETLLEKYGDRTLELPDGSVELEEVVNIADENRVENVEAVRETVFNLVGDEAVGRKGYSDLGVSSADEDGESLSF